MNPRILLLTISLIATWRLLRSNILWPQSAGHNDTPTNTWTLYNIHDFIIVYTNIVEYGEKNKGSRDSAWKPIASSWKIGCLGVDYSCKFILNTIWRLVLFRMDMYEHKMFLRIVGFLKIFHLIVSYNSRATIWWLICISFVFFHWRLFSRYIIEVPLCRS